MLQTFKRRKNNLEEGLI